MRVREGEKGSSLLLPSCFPYIALVIRSGHSSSYTPHHWTIPETLRARGALRAGGIYPVRSAVCTSIVAPLFEGDGATISDGDDTSDRNGDDNLSGEAKTDNAVGRYALVDDDVLLLVAVSFSSTVCASREALSTSIASTVSVVIVSRTCLFISS